MIEYPMKPWKASILPNGVWEVVEYTYFIHDTAFTYRTVIRGINRHQARVLEEEHNKAIGYVTG